MPQEFRTGSFWRAVLAEFVGMIVFVFIGIMTAIGNLNNSNPDQEVKVALAFGLAIATLAQTLGHISGAHLNPAVTLGMLVSCQISVLRALLYIAAQMLGAAVASGIAYGVRPSNVRALGVNSVSVHTSLVYSIRSQSGLGLNEISKEMNPGQGFGIEFLATFQLVLCVLATTDSRRSDVTGSAPLAIGLSVALGHLAAISYTGCGINPARSFGPAVVMAEFNNHWVYWLAPMLGGVVSALVYDFLLQPHSESFRVRMRAIRGGAEA